MRDVQSGGKMAGMRKGPKVIAHIRIIPTENDGHIVEHHHESPSHMGAPMHEMEAHSFGEGEDQKMLDHVAHHLNLETGEDAKHEEETADHAG